MMRARTIGFAISVAVATAALTGCGNKQHGELRKSEADSLFSAAKEANDYGRMLLLADSLEERGRISAVKANCWRGFAYDEQDQERMAEDFYEKALSANSTAAEDQQDLQLSARNLANIRMLKGDYEGTLRATLPALEKAKELNLEEPNQMADILNSTGFCQLNLGRIRDAAASYESARRYYEKVMTEDKTRNGIEIAIVGMSNPAIDYLNARMYEEALPWIDRYAALQERYLSSGDTNEDFVDENMARLNFCRAVAMQGLGYTTEAAIAYRKALATNYAKTSSGRIDATDYLMAAGRYAEASDIYRDLDRMIDEWDVELTLDNIQGYLFAKYRANVAAGRKDSALVTGSKILDALDTAIVQAKNDATAELAALYDTQAKERKIAEQQADLTQQRLVGTAIALVLLTLFFVAYTLYRRHVAKRMAEMKAAQERIESELRIARDIQMSMLPSEFPEREGLDMYASMTPAKEVGGDLYGYVLQEDRLYFAIGDVSGKGVPASLFMAQATRLFRTLATQGMMPDEICTRMNDALAGEDNESGMFVTLFLGLIDLKTGHIVFCNAGHNPPVIGSDKREVISDKCEFLEMIPNAPIGLWPGLEYEGEEIADVRGRTLFIYTDGLNEAENRKQEQFGEDRLLAILRNKDFRNARQVVDTLAEEVEHHRDGADPNDDLTMMCIRISNITKQTTESV